MNMVWHRSADFGQAHAAMQSTIYTKVRKTVWGSFAHLDVAECLRSKIRPATAGRQRRTLGWQNASFGETRLRARVPLLAGTTRRCAEPRGGVLRTFAEHRGLICGQCAITPVASVSLLPPLLALRSQLSALSSPLSALRSQLSALSSPLSALRSQLSALSSLLFAPLFAFTIRSV
jgi:hypothetical protein